MAPTRCSASVTARTARAPSRTAGQRRVKPRPITAAAPSATAAAHGQGRGGGHQVTSPLTVTGRSPCTSATFQPSITTWQYHGSAFTESGGSLDIQWARWSCHRAVRPVEIRFHSGGAFASKRAGGADDGVMERLRNVAGERSLRNTPPGPTRR